MPKIKLVELRKQPASKHLTRGQTHQLRREGSVESIPVLIRYPSFNDPTADVTLFPGRSYEQAIGSFNLNGWFVEVKEPTLEEQLEELPSGSTITFPGKVNFFKESNTFRDDPWISEYGTRFSSKVISELHNVSADNLEVLVRGGTP